MSKLYIVPTPIGNLEDFTFRAVRILKAVDLILAEDTRKTRILLNHYGIEKKMIPYHAFNEHSTVNGVLDKLKQGDTLAIVTDAGTPSISDPGYLLIRECLRNGYKVECLPGATAFVPALVNSGIPSDRFRFEGFLPHKKGRHTRLKELGKETITIIFYESPHRLIKTLEQLAEYFGENRLACVSRELTKIHEENMTLPLKELLDYYKMKPVKGEIVIIVEGQSQR